MKLTLSTDIAAPPVVVWDYISDIKTHTDWMRDAVDIQLIGHQTQGVGTRFACETKVGPLRMTDTMEITEWSPGQKMGVRHTGHVSGEGVFSMRAVGAGDGAEGGGAAGDGADSHTHFEWSEVLRFPWRLGGPVGELLAYPVLRSMWKGNLRRLKKKIEERK